MIAGQTGWGEFKGVKDSVFFDSVARPSVLPHISVSPSKGLHLVTNGLERRLADAGRAGERRQNHEEVWEKKKEWASIDNAT